MSPPTSQSHTIDIDMDQTLERAAFNNRTNRYDDEELPRYLSQKRHAPEDHKPPRKRAKLVSTNEPINELAESKESDDDDDVVDDDVDDDDDDDESGLPTGLNKGRWKAK